MNNNKKITNEFKLSGCISPNLKVVTSANSKQTYIKGDLIHINDSDIKSSFQFILLCQNSIQKEIDYWTDFLNSAESVTIYGKMMAYAGKPTLAANYIEVSEVRPKNTKNPVNYKFITE